MSTSQKITNCFLFICIGISLGFLRQISIDIYYIRAYLVPKPLSQVEAPPFRARVEFREDAHQEPRTTLL
jgi:hypothetical protein